MSTSRYTPFIHRLAAPGFAALLLVGCSKADVPSNGPPASADAGGGPESSAAPSELDERIEALWAAAGVKPMPAVTDAAFQRRVTLDLIGRVPTADEIDAFHASGEADRREALVDRLLASEEYAEYWAEIDLDLLLGRDPKTRRQYGEPLRRWLEAARRDNRPWDEMADAMITATGELDESPEGAFLVGRFKEGKVANVTGKTGEVFLGVQVQCAQCHDHPYAEDFSQADFWSLGAYYARTRARGKKVDGKRTFRLVDARRGEMRIPGDGDEKGRVVQPAFLGAPFEPMESETRRETLSRAIRSSDLFGVAAVGHTWSQLFGRGLVEPWNDISLDGKGVPELLRWLGGEFERGGFDRRTLLRRLVLSTAYQRSSAGPAEGRAKAEAAFARARVRPQNSHQLFRSLFTVTGIEDVENRKVRRRVRRARKQAEKQYVFAFADDEMADTEAFSGNVPQSLLLLNGELTNQGVVARPGTTLGSILEQETEPGPRVDALYLAVYGRKPDATERRRVVDFLANGGGREAYEDLMFAMIYSSEFLSNH